MCLSEVLLILGCVFWLQILPLSIPQINILHALGQGGRGSACPSLTKLSILTANRSDDVATTILEMVVDLWITVRGFSLAGAWVEEYKITQKKTTQKSKALRKQLN